MQYAYVLYVVHLTIECSIHAFKIDVKSAIPDSLLAVYMYPLHSQTDYSWTICTVTYVTTYWPEY